jgi:hypothetical protein
MIGGIIGILLLFIIGYWAKPWYIGKSSSLSQVYNFGMFFRIIGTTTYIIYAIYFSGGAVDAFVYDNYAAVFAEYFVNGDLSPFTNERLWRGGQFFHTNFVAYPAAIFMIVTFNSMFGIYLLFSLVCFLGLVYMLKAFANNYPQVEFNKLSMLLFFFPALWFWTSTIGKDAFMFLGLGLVCYGISDKKLNYIRIALGIAITYAFRPPAAYMVIIAMAAFFIINVKDSFFAKTAKIVMGIIMLIFMMNYLSEKWGIEDLSSESISELQSGTLRNNNYGSGALEQKSGGLSSIPRGVLDVLARPFIWEGTNPLALASSLEINFVLFLLYTNRRSVSTFLKESLRHRLSTFILAFLVIYILSVGLFENNIGLIARHRAIIFPFLFIMAYGYYHTPRRGVVKSKNKPSEESLVHEA